MDREIEGLIKTYKQAVRKGSEDRTLTKDERKKFDVLSASFIKQQLEYLYPGESVHLVSLNSDEGKLVFDDGPNRRTIDLKQLGYEFREGEDHYVRGKSIMRRKAELSGNY